MGTAQDRTDLAEQGRMKLIRTLLDMGAIKSACQALQIWQADLQNSKSESRLIDLELIRSELAEARRAEAIYGEGVLLNLDHPAVQELLNRYLRGLYSGIVSREAILKSYHYKK